MTMLSASDLSGMQATLEASLPALASIERVTRTPDGMGGWTGAWAAIASNVPVRVAPAGLLRGDERIIGAGVAALTEWIVTLPEGQDIKEADRIRIDGRTLEAKQVNLRSWELARRVYCTEVV